MACERCGCHLVARAAKATRGGPALVCADCGHPADPRLHGEQTRRSWLAVVALLGIALVGCLILTLSLLQDSRQEPGGESKPAAERAE